jgi:predicted metal-dependent hydrolase
MKPEHDLTHVPIVPRESLDFGLDTDIPRYWMDNDPFKTRFFDAMSTLFPQGEKFFITSVREFKDDVTDPQLQAEVRDFTRQEAQHSLVHRQFNDRLAAQGVDIAKIDADLAERFFVKLPKLTNRNQRLAATAALEHLTAMMCTTFFERRELLETSDPRVRAMYAWHAIEEVEHKAVAFDVLTRVAKVSYLRRVISMIITSIGFPFTVAIIMNHMFKVDGFSFLQRARLWAKGLWWFYKPGGLFIPALGYYFAYYKPGFHPWKVKEMPSYGTWLATYTATGDAIAAGNALHAAGR